MISLNDSDLTVIRVLIFSNVARAWQSGRFRRRGFWQMFKCIQYRFYQGFFKFFFHDGPPVCLILPGKEQVVKCLGQSSV